MTLQQIVERLRAQCPSLVSVELVYDLSALAEPQIDTPAAFVQRLSDAFDPNTGMGALVSQRRNRRFGVISVARTPGATDEPLETVRNEILAALIGWAPSGENIQITAVSGEAAAIEAGLVRWLDTFSYDEYERRTP